LLPRLGFTGIFPNRVTNETFTCLCREDFVLMSELFLDNKERIFPQGLSVRIVENSRGKQLKDWQAPCSQDQLGRLGFDSFLKDMLTGPEHVINTLCHSNNIHSLVFLPDILTNLGHLTPFVQSCSE
jgi:hypothetical protein